MFFGVVDLFFLVVKSVHEGLLVSFIGNGHLAISREIDSVYFIVDCVPLLGRNAVVDWDNTQASLFKVLHVGFWHVSHILGFNSMQHVSRISLTCVGLGVQVSSKRLSHNSNHRSSGRINVGHRVSELVFHRRRDSFVFSPNFLLPYWCTSSLISVSCRQNYNAAQRNLFHLN